MTKKNRRDASVQELLNIEDVRDGFLLTKDLQAIGFLRVQPISVSLMTETEKEQLTRRITTELSPLRKPFTILLLSKPTDVKAIIDYLEEVKAAASDTLRRDCLTKTMKYLSNLSLSGQVLDRYAYVSFTSPAAEKEELTELLRSAQKAFEAAGIRSEILDNKGVLQLCAMFYNPADGSIALDPTETGVPVLS